MRGHRGVSPARGRLYAIRGHVRPGRLVTVVGHLQRPVFHQYRPHAATIRHPVRVLPCGHARPGQLRGRIHRHVHVHRDAEGVPTCGGRV